MALLCVQPTVWSSVCLFHSPVEWFSFWWPWPWHRCLYIYYIFTWPWTLVPVAERRLRLEALLPSRVSLWLSSPPSLKMFSCSIESNRHSFHIFILLLVDEHTHKYLYGAVFIGLLCSMASDAQRLCYYLNYIQYINSVKVKSLFCTIQRHKTYIYICSPAIWACLVLTESWPEFCFVFLPNWFWSSESRQDNLKFFPCFIDNHWDRANV